MKMKLICVLYLISFATCEPQLDLPRVQTPSSPREDGPEVLVLPNSYANEQLDVEKKSDSNYRFESDRSQRYG